MNQKEYTELQLLYKTEDFKLEETGKEMIKIKYDKNKIYFTSQGDLGFFNKLSINLTDTTILLVDNLLKFEKVDSVISDKNVFKSKWIGYTWQYTFPNNYTELTIDSIKTNLIKRYQITIGKLLKPGKTFIHIKGFEMINGEKYIDFEAPIIFE